MKLPEELLLRYQLADLRVKLIDERLGRLQDSKLILVDEFNEIVNEINAKLAVDKLSINDVTINMRTGEVVKRNS